MSCCGGNIASGCNTQAGELEGFLREEELKRGGRVLPNGAAEYVFSVPDIKCGACIGTVERNIAALEGVDSVRANLTLRRVTVRLEDAKRAPGFLFDAFAGLGYPAKPLDLADQDKEQKRQSSELLRALAVAGFAAGNIMLLSVSVWSGADGATRDLFHFISAMIALPAVAYSGRPFFRSAWAALRSRQLNMDVPISLGVTLAIVFSLYETFNSGAEAYFDAAVTLLFFLLVGRYLDQLMRERARSAVTGLARLASKGALAIAPDGEISWLAVDEIAPGMRLRVPAGERVPVDGEIIEGAAELDRSLVTGESAPVRAVAGDKVEAGTLNLTGSLDIRATKAANESFLAEVLRLLEAAEKGRSAYERVADRMARAYAPAVHLLSLSAFLFWMAVSGDLHHAVYTAIAVLIITCPCALALAVPVVHVIGAGRLFQLGILMRDGSALERLAEADYAVFDKTGTLTTGTPVAAPAAMPEREAAIARALAQRSVHPASRAVAAALAGVAPAQGEDIRELPGFGMEGVFGGRRARLGRAAFVAEIAAADGAGHEGLAFAVEASSMRAVELGETLRRDAASAIGELASAGIQSEILSGDAAPAVAGVAARLGVAKWSAGETPASKIARLEALRAAGAKTLMVGDGLNDAPALAAGHVSFAPASASDAGRFAADFVFTRDELSAVPQARRIAVKAKQLVRQNFGLAIAYNLVFVPLAFAGYVTPLLAAVAMSSSSIIVLANSMRLQLRERKQMPERETSPSLRLGVQA